jgi:sialic acid synthase SpsE
MGLRSRLFLNKKNTYIIAEVGSNHNRDLNLAKKHILKAKEAGADAVKFQSLDLDKLYFKPTKEQIDLHSKIDFPSEWLAILKEYCDEIDIDFCSSATYLDGVDELENIDVKFHKIASAQVGTFPQIVKKIAKLKKPTIFSTGLVSIEELDKVIEIFRKENHNNFTILHCNSIYPTPYDKVNLDLIRFYKERYKVDIGFSDHTLGIHIPIIAVSLGATVIEKHFKINDEIETPDSPISINFLEFKQMVKDIRDVEKSLIRKNRKKIEEDEQSFKDLIRYKLILKNSKKVGESFNGNDFCFLRSKDGIDVENFDLIISDYLVKNDIITNTVLQWKNLKKKG